MHFCNLVDDRFAGCVVAHVDNHRFAARAQHAMHLTYCADGIAEVLESRTANDKVECVGIEWQGRGVTFLEIDLDLRTRGIVAGDADERPADIEPGDSVGTGPRQLNSEITGS